MNSKYEYTPYENQQEYTTNRQYSSNTRPTAYEAPTRRTPAPYAGQPNVRSTTSPRATTTQQNTEQKRRKRRGPRMPLWFPGALGGSAYLAAGILANTVDIDLYTRSMYLVVAILILSLECMAIAIVQKTHGPKVIVVLAMIFGSLLTFSIIHWYCVDYGLPAAEITAAIRSNIIDLTLWPTILILFGGICATGPAYVFLPSDTIIILV